MTDVFQVRDERKPGHHWADNEVLDVYGPVIGVHGYAVYMAIARHSSNTTAVCTKSQSEIGRMLQISTDTVGRAIERLIDARLVAKRERTGRTSELVLLAVPKQRIVPKGQLTNSSLLPENLPLTAVGDIHNHPLTAECGNPDLPLIAAPPTAHSGTPTAHSGRFSTANKEERLSSRLKTKPSASDDADPRHALIREYIQVQHSRTNGMSGLDVPWDGREGAALKRFLEQHPHTSTEDLKACVDFYYASDLNIAQRPAKFIPRLLEFWAGPLNQYGTPKHMDKEYQKRMRSRSEACVGMR